jgi:dephospho-CoA kinase
MNTVEISSAPTPGRGLGQDEALSRIIRFTQRFGEAHFTLACHAAFPLALTPELLYQIWGNFVPQAPWTAVADILLSSLSREIGQELYEMDVTVRSILLEDLMRDARFGRRHLQILADFVILYTSQQLDSDDPDVSELAEAQKWNSLAYLNPSAASYQLAKTISDLIEDHDIHNRSGDISDLIRVISLIETLSALPHAYRPLVTYARGCMALLHKDFDEAKIRFDEVYSNPKSMKEFGFALYIPGDYATTQGEAEQEQAINWVGADLRKRDLQGTSLRSADLTNVNLEGVNLSDSDLAECVLAGANLRYANLTNASLEGVDLSGADLTACILEGANLRRSDLTGIQIDQVREIHSLVWCSDQFLASSYISGVVRIWNVDSGKCVIRMSNCLPHLLFDPSQEVLAIRRKDGELAIWMVGREEILSYPVNSTIPENTLDEKHSILRADSFVTYWGDIVYLQEDYSSDWGGSETVQSLRIVKWNFLERKFEAPSTLMRTISWASYDHSSGEDVYHDHKISDLRLDEDSHILSLKITQETEKENVWTSEHESSTRGAEYLRYDTISREFVSGNINRSFAHSVHDNIEAIPKSGVIVIRDAGSQHEITTLQIGSVRLNKAQIAGARGLDQPAPDGGGTLEEWMKERGAIDNSADWVSGYAEPASEQIIVGIAATIGAGSTTALNHLIERYGFTFFSLGGPLKREAIHDDIPDLRNRLQELARDLRAIHGDNYLAKKLRMGRSWQANDSALVVVDGFKNIAEVEEFRKHQRFALLGIDAPLEIRWKRVRARRKPGDPKTYEQFREHDALDRGLVDTPHSQEVDKLLQTADTVLINDGTIPEFLEDIDEFVHSLLPAARGIQ